MEFTQQDMEAIASIDVEVLPLNDIQKKALRKFVEVNRTTLELNTGSAGVMQ